MKDAGRCSGTYPYDVCVRHSGKLRRVTLRGDARHIVRVFHHTRCSSPAFQGVLDISSSFLRRSPGPYGSFVVERFSEEVSRQIPNTIVGDPEPALSRSIRAKAGGTILVVLGDGAEPSWATAPRRSSTSHFVKDQGAVCRCFLVVESSVRHHGRV